MSFARNLWTARMGLPYEHFQTVSGMRLNVAICTDRVMHVDHIVSHQGWGLPGGQGDGSSQGVVVKASR